MKGCLTAIGGLTLLGVIIAALAGRSSNPSSTTTATTTAAPAATTATTTPSKPTPAAATKTCGSTQANAHASCPFAENVYTAYSAYVDAHHSAPESIEAYSPVTRHTYTLSCAVQGAVSPGATVVCSEDGASVQFGFPREAESQTSSEEEDKVGSTSHATDQQFCEAHKCIGDFTTEDGTIVECTDGTYSHAGGIYGACSYHGGEAGGGGGQYSKEEEGSSE